MRRALAIQMLATARQNLGVVDRRIEEVQRLLFAYEDDEVLGYQLRAHTESLHDHALALRRGTESIDEYREETDDE